MTIVPAPSRLRQENYRFKTSLGNSKFEANLDYIVKPYLKK
jgi:hypothetical protein